MAKILKSKIFLIGGDILIFYLCFLLSIYIRNQTLADYVFFTENLIKFSILLIIWLFVFYSLNLYNLNKFHSRFDYFKKQIIATVILTGISTLFFYWYPQYANVTPKTILLIFSGLFLVLWIGFRFLIFYLLSKSKENYLIIGSSHIAHRLFEELSGEVPQNKKIYIYSDAFLLNVNDLTQMISPPKENLINTIKETKIDKIIFDKNLTEAQDIINLFFSEIANVKSEFYELNDFYEMHHQKIHFENIDKKWFIYNLKPGNKLYFISKRTLDIVFSFLGLLLLIPLFPLIALLIKIDSKGPVVYKQQRIGQNKRVFYIYKFRTMTHSDNDIQICATKKDKRITRVGQILRKTHLDELPQIINIFKGHISLVGPRPEQPLIVEQLSKQIHFYNQRHLIKPGLTGWAQINYPYCATLKEHEHKLQYDLYYLKNKSLIFDLKIIIKTINKVLF